MKTKLCYFNSRWNIYLYSNNPDNYKEWIDNPELTTIIADGGEYRLRKHKHAEIPICSFGWMANEPRQRPGHGGEWSSNSMQINKIFNTDLLEIALDQISVAVSIDWLKKHFADNVTWEEHHIYGYSITHVKEYENERHKWVELPIVI